MKNFSLKIVVLLVIGFLTTSLVVTTLEEPLHGVGAVDPVKVKQGFEIVTKGYMTLEDGSRTGKQSKYFTCIDCHNTVKEFEDISKDNATDRLAYMKEKNLPYVPGSTLYGIVNRKTWYNDDYEKKYGSLVTSSRDTLKNAIQLCATVCSQGRALDEKEMDAILHYLWSIAYSKEDLQAAKGQPVEGFRAHFVETLSTDQRKLGVGGDSENGKYIYENACLHCHDREFGPATFKLDNSLLTLRMLKRHFNDFTDLSIYQIIRHGTYPIPSNKAYMPLFTKEKMSDEQIEDLAAYIVEGSK